MKSALPKVLHRAAGRPLIDRVLGVCRAAFTRVGHCCDRSSDRTIAVASGGQWRSDRHSGTPARDRTRAPAGGTVPRRERPAPLLLLSGDVPLLRPATVQALVAHHVARRAAATVLTATVPDPSGYGRIVREDGAISAIVEHKDATAAERQIAEINSGVYAFDLAPLFPALRRIGSSNAQGEYYLPDLVRVFRAQGLPVETVSLPDPLEILGVNSRKELAQVSAILRDRKNDELMAVGRDDRGSAHDLGPTRRRRRVRYGAASWGLSRGSDPDRLRLRDSRQEFASSTRRSATGSSSTTSASSGSPRSRVEPSSVPSPSSGRRRRSARTPTWATSSS